MKIKNGRRWYQKYMIHSTTDEFTVGTTASSGCLRVKMKDMLDLYGKTAPDVKEGNIRKVPLEVKYECVEFGEEGIVVHADVYDRKINYLDEIKKLLNGAGVIDNQIKFDELDKFFSKEILKFSLMHEKILELLIKRFPHNFVPDEFKHGLHSKINIEDILI